jgi:hypothetical protein
VGITPLIWSNMGNTKDEQNQEKNDKETDSDLQKTE